MVLNMVPELQGLVISQWIRLWIILWVKGCAWRWSLASGPIWRGPILTALAQRRAGAVPVSRETAR